MTTIKGLNNSADNTDQETILEEVCEAYSLSLEAEELQALQAQIPDLNPPNADNTLSAVSVDLDEAPQSRLIRIINKPTNSPAVSPKSVSTPPSPSKARLHIHKAPDGLRSALPEQPSEEPVAPSLKPFPNR
jgi:hypothetical protein